ncbi:SDR family oxidoreductase [Leucobacter rhizosphaerae]|uniref:SDR family oxidoreductase n=1 Tax=Leucobacter rhizosphaerae TaxID=2932245 RepID=A0ABY4FYX7_9MICO|nr:MULTISPECIES: SDR family oxidoreductase [Leucobacter]UOQ61491.1 SDR family oxidoreductase [Leucobacter rhizosphaerae]UOR02405.1 SDR family oxidoreductase [Leucobacter allii]
MGAEVRIDGQCAIVTGGARGIGRAYTERLRSMGASVAVLDLSFDEEHGVDRPAESGRGALLGISTDLTDEKAARAAFAEARERLGRVDVLVCNAGGGTGAMWENSPLSMDLNALRRAYEVNVASMALSCREIAPGMVSAGRGKILTVASTAALRARSDGGYAHYASAKAAVIAFTNSLAREVAPAGVTANVIVPGAIGTERLLPKMEAMGMDSVLRDIPLGRLGTPEDCANALEFLAGPLSDYITGTVVRVDGGMMI